MSTCISAVQHIRRLRGGSQAQLLRASDGAYYVCKFLNNPQHTRVLANEMFATRLGHLLGLCMPQVEIIDVSEWLIEHSPRFPYRPRRFPDSLCTGKALRIVICPRARL